jgi:hypothetical protein
MINWRSLFERIKGILVALMAFHFLVGFLGNLMIASVSSGIGLIPSWFEMPFSLVNDFFEAPDGAILVHIGLYHRIQRYSPDGKFLGAWNKVGTKGIDHWSVTEDGHIFECFGDAIVVFNNNGERVDRMVTSLDGYVGWQYLGDGRAEAFAMPDVTQKGFPSYPSGAPPLPRGVVRSGEVVCTAARDRLFYSRQDGGAVLLTGNHLEVVDENGRPISVLGTPWYLWWAEFPFPAVLGLAFPVAFILISETLDRIRHWRRNRTI